MRVQRRRGAGGGLVFACVARPLQLGQALSQRLIVAARRVDVVHPRDAQRQDAFLDHHRQDALAAVDREADFVGNIVRSDRTRREDDDQTAAGANGALDRAVPMLARTNVELVDPHRDAAGAQILGEAQARTARRFANSSGNRCRGCVCSSQLIAPTSEGFDQTAVHSVERGRQPSDLVRAAVVIFGRIDLAHADRLRGFRHALDRADRRRS